MRILRIFSTWTLSVLTATSYAHPLRRAWIFETNLTGAMNQRRGVVERVVDRVETLRLPDPESRTAVDPSAFVRQTLGLRRYWPASWPDLIVHTEPWAHETDLILGLRALAPKPLRVVHLEDSTYRRAEYDLVVNANYQSPRPGPNVIHTTGVATRVSAARVADEVERWRGRLAWLPRPLTLVALGGAMDFLPFQDTWTDELGRRLNAHKLLRGGSLLISASRRTPPSALARLMDQLRGVPFLIYDARRDGDENPYLAGLGLADRVVVTGDSLSMIADALVLGIPPYVHTPAWSLESAHARLTEDLYLRGLAQPFVGDEIDAPRVVPVDAAADIAAEIKRRFCAEALGGA